MLKHVRFVIFAFGFLILLSAVGRAAEPFPSRPITLVVPFGPGGAIDIIPRLLAERMAGALGRPVIVENIAGASGSIGVGRVARAEPDGYTIVFGSWSTHVVNGAVYDLKYKLTDFEPIILVASQPVVILSKNDVPANNLKELIAWLKDGRAPATMGTAGVGGLAHVAGVYFAKGSDTKFIFVPFRGNGQIIQNLVANQVDIGLDTAASALPSSNEKLIKAYAVMAKKRLSSAPNLPTVDEAGLPGVYVSTWYGMWAPIGTPKEIVEKINAAVSTALKDPAVATRLRELGPEITPENQQSPEDLRAFHNAEIEKWWPLLKAAGIKAE